MKKIFYFFLLISNGGMAQVYYSHYLDETSEWRYFQWPASGSSATSSKAVSVYFDGTEVINNYVYYKRYKAIKTIYSGNISVIFDVYLREDINGNFYRYDTATNTDILELDNNYIISFQNGTLIPNITGGTPCPAQVSFVEVSGLNLKRVTAGGYGFRLEGVGNSMLLCMIAGSSTIYSQLCSYTKQGNIYSELCSTSAEFPVPNRTNLNNHEFELVNMKIAPNPTSGNVQIESDSMIKSIEIIDVQGRSLELLHFNAYEIQFDMSRYQIGSYFAKIATSSGNITKKMIRN